MTPDDILEGILRREGEGVPPYDDPVDRGGRTSWGISERAHPEAWDPGPPNREQARAIYTQVYVAPFDGLVGLPDRVRTALIDDGVLSGVETAIRSLQRVLGVREDGILGPQTIGALSAWEDDRLLLRLVQRRAHRLARIVEREPDQARFVVGWIDRALSLLG